MNLKKILQFSIGPIGAAALSLITLPFVAWFFTVEDVGRLTMLQVVLSLAVSLFSLAMHQAYVREYHEEDDKQALFKVSVIPGLAVLLLVSVITIALPFSISMLLFEIDSTLLSFMLFIGIFASFFINFLAHVVRMQERGLVFSATKITPKLFLLIFIGLIMLLNLKAEFKTLMIMNTLAVLSSLMMFLWLTRDTWLPALKKNVSIVLLIKMLKFSLPLVAGGIAYWGLTTMDRFFLRSLSGFDELGIYAVAVALAGAVSVVSSIFSNIWHPILYKWAKEGIAQKKVQCVIDNMIIFVALIWSLAGVFSFIVPWFLPKEYQAIEYLIVACVAMPLFYLLSETTGVGIGITRRSKYSMFASISAFLVNALLNYLLIPDYGATGAALATVLAFFVFFIVKTEFSARLWCAIPRIKMYILILSYVIGTLVMVLSKANLGHFYLMWVFLFVFTCLLYRSRVSENVNILKFFLEKR
ncbi:lipopolysaccharide biosynthesis protein [Pseudoalteromonas sp. 2CM28B]|uniref:lipopolysaccharide biosynthesis protein n=1 Tax=Pseudoalteromonas sp. 2CM28B TaxID=2929851 RepID=UPI0020C125DF|nr:oligosaccharide flippase family protein [Pseudoalteromonas sp. 2CM28B]MCK8137049.1 oligosaccharide flippase family protein [Pseudoalteromonas sp. 2CM28B]